MPHRLVRNPSKWKWLLPTIREDNSEVWVTFNPEMTTDPTYLRFVHDPAEGAIVRHVNYWDNPWFPASLELERLTDKRRLTNEDYECIWEGKPKRAVTGAIYAGEVEAHGVGFCGKSGQTRRVTDGGPTFVRVGVSPHVTLTFEAN